MLTLFMKSEQKPQKAKILLIFSASFDLSYEKHI